VSIISSAAGAVGWLLADPPPTPNPLPTYIGNNDVVTPGWIGFAVTFLVAVATVLLIVDMTRRIRRLRYRAEIRERLENERLENGSLENQRLENESPESGSPKSESPESEGLETDNRE
jgi:hypothetical protein